MASDACSKPTSLKRTDSRSSQGSDTSKPTTSVPTAAVDKSSGADDSSKLRTFLSILKRFIGVADIAAVRFSLPSQLLEPIPNLEYWQYLDRPETFVSIADSDEALGRMLGALRFWFTKDLKYVKGKPCKPYNSTLGEFFRCNWEVDESLPPVLGPTAQKSKTTEKPIRISYITEQTSHHPPVSAYQIECPEKGISGQGLDQLSANFTGTRIRVSPGEYNKGIYITLHNFDDETYNLTHPTAHLSGLLKGSLYISVADVCYITCPKSRLKTILHYLDEGWLGKTQNKLQGVVFKYDPDKDNKMKIKDVPDSDIVARIDGCWQEKVYWSKGSKAFAKSEQNLLIDVQPLWPMPKIIPPEDEQLPNESRKFWEPVTTAILNKQYGQATTEKQQLEERQREKAAERKARKVEWKPRFFKEVIGEKGKPVLSEEGRKALDKLHKGDYHLEPSVETGA